MSKFDIPYYNITTAPYYLSFDKRKDILLLL